MREYGHGGDIYSRKIEYDFSANINPLGMPGSVRKALIASVDAYEHYPDSVCRELADAIARYEAAEFLRCAGSQRQRWDGSGGNIWAPRPEHIVCGNGAADLIYRIVHVLHPKKALLPVPSFSEYAKALKSVGCEVEHFLLEEEHMFRLGAGICKRITEDIDMLFLCNPNNPIGNTIQPSVLLKILEHCHRRQVFVVLDECFMEFVDGAQDKSGRNCLGRYPNLILLKAFTKVYAMAGLRLGYLVCRDAWLADRIWNEGQCWGVSVPAQVAGVAALREEGYVERTRQYVAHEREYLKRGLEGLGFSVFPGEANYLFFRVPNEVGKLGEKLLKRGIAIRDCSNYRGLDSGCYRTAVRTHEENVILVDAIRECMGAVGSPPQEGQRTVEEHGIWQR